MSVAFRSSSSVGYTSFSGTVNIPVPSGAQAGDIALCSVSMWSTSGTPTITPPSGFTQVGSTIANGNVKQALFWKRLTGSDSGSYGVSFSVSQWHGGRCTLLTGGLSSGDPIEDHDSGSGSGTSIGSRTVTAATAPFLWWAVQYDDVSVSAYPSDFTGLETNTTGGSAYRIPGGSGTYSSANATLSGSTAWNVFLIAVAADSEPPAEGFGTVDNIGDLVGGGHAPVVVEPSRYYLRDTQTEPGTGGTVFDLSETQGSSTTLGSGNTQSAEFVEMIRFQRTVDDTITGEQFPCSINMDSVSHSTLEWRWVLQRRDSSGTVQAGVASAVHNTAGVKTQELTLATTWQSGDRLAVSLQLRRTSGGGNRSFTVNINDADTHVNATTAEATPSGSGTVDTVGQLDGEGSTSRSGSGEITAAAGLAGEGHTTSAGSGDIDAAMDVAAEGRSARSGSGEIVASADMVGAGLAPTIVTSGSGVIDAIGDMDGAGHADRDGSGTVDAVADLDGSGHVTRSGSGLLDAVASFTGSGHAPIVGASGAGDITATADILGAGHSPRSGSGEAAAIADLVGAAEVVSGPPPLINLDLVALAPVLAHGPALVEIVPRQALAPVTVDRTALAPETVSREAGEPALAHGDTDVELGHGDTDVTLGHGRAGEPEL